jgi:hypothetical protein
MKPVGTGNAPSAPAWCEPWHSGGEGMAAAVGQSEEAAHLPEEVHRGLEASGAQSFPEKSASPAFSAIATTCWANGSTFCVTKSVNPTNETKSIVKVP